jgi:hypothetical protein
MNNNEKVVAAPLQAFIITIVIEKCGLILMGSTN